MKDRIIAVDIETTGLDWGDRVICISLARQGPEGIETMCLNVGYEQRANLFGLISGPDVDSRDREIKPLTTPEAREAFHAFARDGSLMVFHNGSFDIPYIVRSGILTREELMNWDLFDTMVMARCTGPHESVALGTLVVDFGIDVESTWFEMKDVRGKLLKQPWDKVKKYAELDADYTLQIAEIMVPLARSMYDEDFLAEESNWLTLCSLLRLNGIQTDMDSVNKKRRELKLEILELHRELMTYRIRGPNHRTTVLRWIQSIDQTSRLNLTKTGKDSIDETSLKKLSGVAVPVVKLILEARHKEKELSTWVELPLNHAGPDGRIHPMFTVSGARSNRLSCSHPSAHTIPKSLEEVLMTARPGYRLVAFDLGQAEMRVAASYAIELSLAREFAKPDADPHTANAIRIFGAERAKTDSKARRKSKNVFFAKIYGGGVRAFLQQANKGVEPEDWISEEEARETLNFFSKALPKIISTSRSAENVWISRGYLVVLGGKRLYASKSDLERSYKAFNYLIQPSVAELVKKSMIEIWQTFPENEVLIVNQKHDSVFFEIRDDDHFSARCDRIKQIMQDAYPEELSNRTDPPILMLAEMELNRAGLTAEPTPPPAAGE